ncbi:MAG: hypothetical protein JST68_15025 [Bacteroidetes bacterium]|nr:hypothetical protein [Bacteroidota bacterium]
MLCFSCQHKKTIVPSYYYWRTNSSIEGEEKALLRKHNIHTLYAKVLDIDWAGVNGAIPVASMDFHGLHRGLNVYDSLNVRLIPVVFITNKTFLEIDSAEIPVLAKRVLRRCLPAYDSMGVAYEAREPFNSFGMARPSEIQFDCDWTAKTAGKYFYFLQTVRRFLPSDSIRLSATIRLHQFKYPDKTGRPPVDRGMLMVYNVGDLRQYSPVNSIFERGKAAAYFTGGKAYPLPLDIALPAYSWGLVFRDRKFYQIENGLNAAQLDTSGAFERKGKPADNGVSFYRVKKDTVFGELFLRPGDEIKVESIDSSQLGAAAELAQRAVNTDSFRVAFFELSSNEIKRFSDETLAQIYHSYQ